MHFPPSSSSPSSSPSPNSHPLPLPSLPMALDHSLPPLPPLHLHPPRRISPLHHSPKSIQIVSAQFPPAKYLILGRRHSIAPERVIWEGREAEGGGEAEDQRKGAGPRGGGGAGGGGPRNRSSTVNRLIIQRQSWQLPRSSSASTGAVPSAQKGDGTVAIDSKIEQAMDLVKTHLIYAVRDEMELLRARIVHLEATVIQLETENAVLREHIPREVLDNLPAHVPPPATAIAQ